MKITVTSLAELAHAQMNMGATKTLSLIEFNPSSAYWKDYTGEKKIIIVGDHEWSVDETSPTMNTVDHIAMFSKTITDEDSVVVHCYAGVSRSTAAALIILYDKLKDVDKAVEILKQIRPIAAPNRRILQLADAYFEHTAPLLYAAGNKMNVDRNFAQLTTNKLVTQ